MIERLHQSVFMLSLLILSWLTMMAFHELGHVIGAWLSGGTVERVVLHPLTISRTDVSPNPNPLLVVWFGPLLGCLVPVGLWLLIPGQLEKTKAIGQFFVGFCLIANGAYIGLGSIEKIGDCAVMLKHGSPTWMLIAFGVVTVFSGLYLWHRLGSIKQLVTDASWIDASMAWGLLLAAVTLFSIEFAFSPT